MTTRSHRCQFADHAMQVWRTWVTSQREHGWPSQSAEARAYERAKTATKVDGVAAWRGQGTPPDMPKETRPKAGSSIPDHDRAKLGPAVDRHLADLSEWDAALSMALKAHYLDSSRDVDRRAQLLGLGRREYYQAVSDGLLWLEGRLARGKIAC